MTIHGIQFSVELEEILSEVSKLSFGYFEKGFRDNNEYIMMQCPYHKEGRERKLSAGIRKDNGVFHCFACSEVHSLPEFISHCFGHEDVSGKSGWKWLLKNFATVQTEERKDVELDYYRNTINNIDTSNKCSSRKSVDKLCGKRQSSQQFVSEEELDNYRWTHSYMKRRRLTSSVIELFDVGYDSYKNAITFPFRDVRGNCLFIARRFINFKRFEFPKGVVKPLYGIYECFVSGIDRSVELIVCEGMFDALTCWVYGRPAVALAGLGNELQIQQLNSLPIRKLILALDNDRAGRIATSRLSSKLEGKILTRYVLPSGKKDINELDKTEFSSLVEEFL